MTFESPAEILREKPEHVNAEKSLQDVEVLIDRQEIFLVYSGDVPLSFTPSRSGRDFLER